MKQLGFMIIGLVSVIVAVRLFSAAFDSAQPPDPPIVAAPASPDLSPPPPTQEQIDDALGHMKQSIEKAAADEQRREKHRKRKRDHVEIPGLQYLGETDRGGHFHPADER